MSVPSVASNEADISILVLVFFQVVHWATLFVWSLAGTFAITVLPSTLFLFKYLGPLLSFVGDGWNWLWPVQWNRTSSRLLVEFVTACSCVIILLFLFSKPLVANLSPLPAAPMLCHGDRECLLALCFPSIFLHLLDGP